MSLIIRLKLPAIAALFAAGMTIPSIVTAGCNGDSAYLGEICTVAFNFCPEGTLEANGQLLPVNQNPALYALLGTAYGGDGRTNFALPDLRARVPVGAGQGPQTGPVKLGEMRGAEQTTLSIGQMPQHNHSATFTPAGSSNLTLSVKNTLPNQAKADSTSYLAASLLSSSPVSHYTNNASAQNIDINGLNGAAGGGTVTVGNTGGNQPISVINPQTAVKYCIVIRGLHPQRP